MEGLKEQKSPKSIETGLTVIRDLILAFGADGLHLPSLKELCKFYLGSSTQAIRVAALSILSTLKTFLQHRKMNCIESYLILKHNGISIDTYCFVELELSEQEFQLDAAQWNLVVNAMNSASAMDKPSIQYKQRECSMTVVDSKTEIVAVDLASQFPPLLEVRRQ